MYQFSKRFQKIKSCTAIRLTNKIFKNLKTILSGTAADPFGKDIIALYRSKSVTKKLFKFSGFGAAKLSR